MALGSLQSLGAPVSCSPASRASLNLVQVEEANLNPRIVLVVGYTSHKLTQPMTSWVVTEEPKE